MKCQEVSAVLEEYFDGELDERHGRTVAAHLGACAACAASYGELQREQDLFMRYERDVEVTPQLWPAVAARIAAENTAVEPVAAAPFGARLRGWLAGTFTAPRFSPALVLVAVVATAGAMRLMQPRVVFVQTIAQASPERATPPQQQGVAPAPSPQSSAAPEQIKQDVIAVKENREKPRPIETRKKEAGRDEPQSQTNAPRLLLAGGAQNSEPQTPDALVRDAAAKYQKAIEILSRDVNQRRSKFDPVTLARFDDTLKALDRTIAETRRAALAQTNSDPVAVQYMLTAYEKKVEVLREMARN